MSTAVTESLTAMERSDLVHLESTIEHGLQTFVEVGEALAKIRDARLYKEDYDTFEAYLSERWGLSRKRGYDLISASRTAVSVSQICDTPPTTESHAAALSGLPADEAADVMRKAHDATDGKVTAKAIKEARKPAPEPEPEPEPETVDAEVIEDEPVNVNRETGEVIDAPPPERSGVTRWSTTIQNISATIPMEKLTQEELLELEGAVQYLRNYIKGEIVTRERKAP